MKITTSHRLEQILGRTANRNSGAATSFTEPTNDARILTDIKGDRLRKPEQHSKPAGKRKMPRLCHLIQMYNKIQQNIMGASRMWSRPSHQHTTGHDVCHVITALVAAAIAEVALPAHLSNAGGSRHAFPADPCWVATQGPCPA